VTKIFVPQTQQYDVVSQLQIQMFDGYFVNLLHIQSILGGLAVGSIVKPGDAIATVGDEGWPDYASGCHLHFEVDKTNVLGDNHGLDVDPTAWLSSTTCENINGLGYGSVTVPAGAYMNSQEHLFVHNPDGSVWHHVYGTLPSQWDCLGGVVNGSPAAAYFNNETQLIVRYADNSVRWASYDGIHTCCSWSQVGTGLTVGDPVVAQLGSELHVFVRASDNTIWENWLNSNSQWQASWRQIPSSINPGKMFGNAALSVLNNQLYIVVRGANTPSTVWLNRELTNDSFTGWTELTSGWTGGAGSNPSSAANTTNGAAVIGLTDSTMLQAAYTAGGWGSWSSLGASSYVVGNPNTLANPYPVGIWVFVHGTDNALWSKLGSGSWTSLGGVLTDDPVAFGFGNATHVFVRGVDKALWEQVFNGTSWSGFGTTSLGGQIN
jgi:murein DD-endopeptidase MepM/ murein hydrolase activator NlpD